MLTYRLLLFYVLLLVLLSVAVKRYFYLSDTDVVVGSGADWAQIKSLDELRVINGGLVRLKAGQVLDILPGAKAEAEEKLATSELIHITGDQLEMFTGQRQHDSPEMQAYLIRGIRYPNGARSISQAWLGKTFVLQELQRVPLAVIKDPIVVVVDRKIDRAVIVYGRSV
jgi:hypothetical protein